MDTEFIRRLKSLTIPDYISILGFFISLISLLIALFGGSIDKETLTIVFILILGLYILLLMLFVIVREYVYSRKAKYSESLSIIHQCAHKLRDAHDAIKRSSDNHVKDLIQRSIVDFANAFSLVTSTRCRACIKTIVMQNVENPKILTETFCRSHRANHNDKDAPKDIKENSDFRDLFNCESNYFIEGDLRKLVGYKNSNWPDN